jgi:hypothetical protein
MRLITWTAYACDISSGKVLMGLAPGMEDALLRRALAPEKLARYASRQIPLSDHAVSGTVELRLYAVREAALCRVEHVESDTVVPGFHRVKVSFACHSDPQNANADESSIAPPVIGFLLTLGLSTDDEQEFFKTVLDDFLSKSWSSLPKLLREVGCLEPSHDAA